MKLPQFSIVTPSYQMTDWLRLCAASVADQHGVEIEHLIQDGCSDDIQEITPWLNQLQSQHSNYDPELRVEEDSGMYQALNRGFARASHDLCAYLNCDEQYLPGALSRVARYFADHPDVDVVFGDVVVIDTEGECLCYRKMIRPRKEVIYISHLPTLTCATFFRREVIESIAFQEKSARDCGRLLGARLAGIWIQDGLFKGGDQHLCAI